MNCWAFPAHVMMIKLTPSLKQSGGTSSDFARSLPEPSCSVCGDPRGRNAGAGMPDPTSQGLKISRPKRKKPSQFARLPLGKERVWCQRSIFDFEIRLTLPPAMTISAGSRQWQHLMLSLI
jgi:hypothetical protein